jgi:hypothetical protein
MCDLLAPLVAPEDLGDAAPQQAKGQSMTEYYARLAKEREEREDRI